ncbi:hypothetical protein HMSSN036_62720 [Paenibacillus macerans]|nr:hypothetical protein HMSSN036_62720 [Paenibacillus macerans]
MYLYRLEAETSAGLLALVIAAEGEEQALPPRKSMCGGIFAGSGDRRDQHRGEETDRARRGICDSKRLAGLKLAADSPLDDDKAAQQQDGGDGESGD